ncbi:nucleoside triphosphate pyrophosphohydrolase [Marinobacterium nitratireducens]|uniref:Nucleoside triphosphate pyrophosphohydrolase n=1 Tax=Marinobacterium nitratireducens TaxID=518897 RepID=A0A917ZHV2_9GAMM|nr:nucleoside triphosphate pyrophosphohydrolase [Marinobacterium nitratireducens]GGO82414.1 nucleoside triphosphate pyrophosphohydrolase [Marinobacterium nitratireducens]
MQYRIDDLVTLMARLRDPGDGCPWDLKQDFASIVPHTLEEAYEVADTIERQDWAHLRDELGDLLFQVIFYARLGEEQQRFDFDAIVDALVRKLIRRHPHVFPAGTLESRAGDQSRSEAQIRESWETIKQQERDDKAKGGVLDDVPLSLPALSRAAKLQKRAARVGFDWPETLQVLDKIEEEIAELREAIGRGAEDEIRDELGDLMFAQVNLARHLGVDPEAALRGTNAKFSRRFAHIEDAVEASGQDWGDFSLAELDALWNEAKTRGL